MLALFVNLLFIAVLVFSVSWQNRKPEAVTAELYAPPTPPASTPKPRPEPPAPKAEPPPVPVPKAEPPPEPKPVPKPPEPVIEKPDQREAEIALQAKRDAERRQQEEAERRKQEEVKRREQEQAERERAATRNRAEGAGAQGGGGEEQAEAKQQAEARRRKQAELRERQAQQVEAMRAQAERETRIRAQAERESQLRAQAERESRTRAQAQRESQMRAQAEQEARGRAEQAAAGAARNKAQLDWIDKIRSRIRGYINLPPGHPGQSGSDLRRRPVADRGNHRREAAQVQRRARLRRRGPARDPEVFTAARSRCPPTCSSASRAALPAAGPVARVRISAANLLFDDLDRGPAPVGALLDQLPQRDRVDRAAGRENHLAAFGVFVRRHDHAS